MKGFETMKKRKIVSFFTAIAIAVACIIVPPADKGLDVVAGAASEVYGGGITLTKEGAANVDKSIDSTEKQPENVFSKLSIEEESKLVKSIDEIYSTFGS